MRRARAPFSPPLNAGGSRSYLAALVFSRIVDRESRIALGDHRIAIRSESPILDPRFAILDSKTDCQPEGGAGRQHGSAQRSLDVPIHPVLRLPGRLGRRSRAVHDQPGIGPGHPGLAANASEFAVEAVIAWEAGKDPSVTHLAIANFTGAIRLLLGLGWPMIYFVAAVSAVVNRRRRTWAEIHLDDEHAIEVIGLVPTLLYFLWIWYKGSISLVNAAVLTTLYAMYLYVLWRVPPKGSRATSMTWAACRRPCCA